MSFEETRRDIEATVIQPLLDFRNKTAPLNHIHNDSMRDFANVMAGLLTGSDGETAFQGSGSMALADIVGSYLTTEQSITGSGNDFVGKLLEAAQICERNAHDLQQKLDTIAAQQDHTVEDAAGIALTLDAGAAAQGGLDIPWDIAAAGASLIAAAIAATHNADQEKEQQAQMARMATTMEVARELSQVQAEPMKALPPSPKKPNGDPGDFLKKLGIGIGIGVLGIIMLNELTPQEKRWAEELAKEKEFADLSLEEILALIGNNPGGKSIDFYRNVLRSYKSIRNRLQSKHPDVPPDVISAIILKNMPSGQWLEPPEYDLLVQHYRGQDPNQHAIPFNVIAVTRAYDGSIVYLTQSQLAHAHKHDRELGDPTDAELTDLVMEALQRQPDLFEGDGWIYKIKTRKGFKELEVVVSRAATSDGMIITVFIKNWSP